MKGNIFRLLVIVNLCWVLHSYSVIDLAGSDWTVINANASIKIPASVPGDIYTDLLTTGDIGIPYYRFNDQTTRWVAYDNWTYDKTFNVPESLLQETRVVLFSGGLDTVGEVYVNGITVLKSESMFTRHIIDVQLTAKDNTVRVGFTSPVEYAAHASNEYESQYNYSVPPDCPMMIQEGECHANMIRKMQSSFSWDWGPAFPTVGIWKELRIEAFSAPVLRDIKVTTTPGTDLWNLKLNLFFTMPDAVTRSGKVSVDVGGFVSKFDVQLQSDKELWSEYTVQIPIHKTDLSIEAWFPGGMEEVGTPKLYKLDVTYIDDQNGTLTNKSMNIGFKEVVLVQEQATSKPEDGLTYFIRINGHDLFLKGSNWIPADSFQSRITTDYIDYLLGSAREANMNAMRIWGGGVYESDYFYKKCDELGILLWHDLMFACAMYPNSSNFLEVASEETRYQIRRLQHHPSIMLWSGNNENEAALAGNWYATSPKYSLFKDNYVVLYIDTLMKIVQDEDPSRPYVPSSPSNGLESQQEGWVAKNPQDPRYGDVHFYDYTQDTWTWSIYPRARMVTEYGIQSWPSFLTMAGYSKPEDWSFNSPFMQSRQHHLLGNIEIMASIGRHFKIPKAWRYSEFNALDISFVFTAPTDSTKVYDDTLWLTQVDAAIGIKTESEFYRRSRSVLVDGQGNTMGCLYWQLNDIWPGASWSSIEYGGRWKVLHYMAKGFYSTDLVSPYIENGTVQVSVVSDSFKSRNMNLMTQVYLWNSTDSLGTNTISFNHPGQSSLIAYSIPVSQMLENSRCPSVDHCFVWYTLTDSESGQVLSTNFLLLSYFLNTQGLKEAKVQVTGSSGPIPTSNGYLKYDLNITTDNVAVFLWLETKIPGFFSQNGFIMKDKEIQVSFETSDRVTLSTLVNSISTRSLIDLY